MAQWASGRLRSAQLQRQAQATRVSADELEEGFRRIHAATGVSDPDQVATRYLLRDVIRESLLLERECAEKRVERARRERQSVGDAVGRGLTEIHDRDRYRYRDRDRDDGGNEDGARDHDHDRDHRGEKGEVHFPPLVALASTESPSSSPRRAPYMALEQLQVRVCR